MDNLTHTALLAYIRLHKALEAATGDPTASHEPVEAAAREANTAMSAAGLLNVTPERLAQLLAELDRRPTTGRCPAAHPDDPTPCDGPPAVTVLDARNSGMDACETHGARLLASLEGGRVYALPTARAGAATRVFKASATVRPFPWLDGPRTEPSQLSHAENEGSPRYVLQPHYIDVDVPGWRLDGPGLDGMHEHETFDADDNRDIEEAMTWAEGIIGSRQDWRHTRRDGLDRWEA